MDERTSLSRRRLLHSLAGAGVIAAADLAWWDEPLISARARRGPPSRSAFNGAFPSPRASR